MNIQVWRKPPPLVGMNVVNEDDDNDNINENVNGNKYGTVNGTMEMDEICIMLVVYGKPLIHQDARF